MSDTHISPIKFNKKDRRFALVMWKDKTLNVTPMKVFAEIEGEYLLDKVYKAMWGDKLYQAKIKFIGTKPQCESQFQGLASYNTNEVQALTNNNAKASSNNDELENEILKHKLKITTEKLAEFESKYKALEATSAADKEKIKELTQKLGNNTSLKFIFNLIIIYFIDEIILISNNSNMISLAQFILNRFEVAMPDAIENLETNKEIETVKLFYFIF